MVCIVIQTTEKIFLFLDDAQVKNKEIINESREQTRENLITSLKPEEMKQVLKEVSDGILGEVKVYIYNTTKCNKNHKIQ